VLAVLVLELFIVLCFDAELRMTRPIKGNRGNSANIHSKEKPRDRTQI
jgi:hypothetical protein